MIKTALIGGTGIYSAEILADEKLQQVSTPYGEAEVVTGNYEGKTIAFIPRHGFKHSIPPHKINYKANIMALKQLGVESIFATSAVGSMYFDYKPGDFILSDQFIDFTRQRETSFYNGEKGAVIHCDMTWPYCPELRESVMEAGRELDVALNNGGVYVCTDGPRFETAAEIAMFKFLGGQLVGMTSVPEVCLARELGICYASLCVVTNYAAGITAHALNHHELFDIMTQKTMILRQLLQAAIKHIPTNKKCSCNSILAEKEVSHWLPQ